MTGLTELAALIAHGQEVRRVTRLLAKDRIVHALRAPGDAVGGRAREVVAGGAGDLAGAGTLERG